MASTSSSSTDAKGEGKAFEDILPHPLLPLACSSSSSMVYDVFLNHRGCDVKEGLAKDIYNALTCKGLRVFLDQEELQIGTSITKEIENAMLSSSLCIAIFSPKYVESPWCLNELSFMVRNNTKIFPVFFNVKPSDLRWVEENVKPSDLPWVEEKKGVYAQAFYQHKKKHRYEAQKLEEWRNALYNVSFLYGHELKNKEDEGRLLKSIVNSVFKDMLIVPLEVARYPAGLDEIVKDFEKTAFTSSDREKHVNIVGIVGMGGSGKTTLSKELYNRECSNFAIHSFIFDVRDAASENTLHSLQEELLNNDLKCGSSNVNIHNIAEGQGILRRRLRSLRVLIVLDDVDHVDQIDALLPDAVLPERGNLAAGSLIIVTTRESNVLKSADISCIYKMKALNPLHSKQLFCWHAFMRSDPVQEFEDLMDEVMKACQGLPLSLKVLGGQLYRRSKDYWVSQLDKFSRILPKDIMKRLRISFDALDREEEEMFMDTACFFLGEEESIAIEVWNGLGLSGLCGWETLLSKCLVELDEQNHIRMHDHLRDMGRQIAMERRLFRLFPSADLSIWRQAQERMLVRGIMEVSTNHFPPAYNISPRPSSDYRPLSKEYIELKPSSCRVQLLVAQDIEFSEEYATLWKELRWLRLFKFEHSCLPSWLSLENLRVLELYGANNLKELWQDNMQQPPLHLKKLSCSGKMSSPIYLRNLPKGKMSSQKYFQNLPEAFCNLQSLEHLELKNFTGLSSLPSRLGDLTNLRHLNLAGCNQLKTLPDSFKQLKHLQYLSLADCSNLTFTEHNANILKNMTKLEYLNFGGCEGLQVLPHHITKQAFLREVNLNRTSFSELPNSIGRLGRLEVLSIGSAELESLPDSLGNLSSLTRLGIHSCRKVRSLPESLGRLALLESIDISSTGVESLPKSLGRLISLQRLTIYDSPMRELIFEFEESSSLPRLKRIDLISTRMSTMSIPEDFCPNLEHLNVEQNAFLVQIRTLPRTVKDISLSVCIRLKDIACIGSLRNLQRLYIYFCRELAELPSFAEFVSIKEIKIIECQISGKMEGLEQLTSLETLEVETQWEVPGITSLEHAQGLRRLELSAEKIGAVEPCIKTLQKWPEQVIIRSRALGGVESLVKAFTSSNLIVVEACADGDEGAEETERNDEADVDDEDDGDEEADEDGCRSKYRKTYLSVHNGGWKLGDCKTCLTHEATIVCFVINCLSQHGYLLLREAEYTYTRSV